MREAPDALTCPECGRVKGLRLLLECSALLTTPISNKGKALIETELFKDVNCKCLSTEEDHVVISVAGINLDMRITLFAESNSSYISCPACNKLTKLPKYVKVLPNEEK